MMNFDLVHVLGAAVTVFGLIWSGLLILKFTKRYEQLEIFWVPWWMVITLIVGVKFL